MPAAAIGGITVLRAERALETGVDSIAAVTAITEADNPGLALRQFQQLCNTIN